MGIAERKAREKEQRSNAIIDAAEQVFFSRGVEAATVDEVAEAAEVSKGTIYLYFSGKDDLMLAIAVRALGIMLASFQEAAAATGSGLERIHLVGQAYSRFYRDYPHYARFMGQYGEKDYSQLQDSPHLTRLQQLGQQTYGIMARVIGEGIADGSIRPDLDPLQTAVTLAAFSEGLLRTTTMAGHQLQGMLGVDMETFLDKGFQLMRNAMKH